VRPTVVELGSQLWGGTLGTSLAEAAVARLESAGIAVRLGTAVRAVTERAVVAGSEELPADLVVAGIGVVPRDELARAAGLEVAAGIVVDDGQRTTADGVWAAGDVAASTAGRFEHWHGARESGERAARSMLGLPLGAPPVPWLFTEVAQRPLDVVGRVTAGDAEHRIAMGVVAYTNPAEADRVTALAVEDGRLLVTRARELVSAGASLAEVTATVEAA
jgi:3-phenylpropionate/trans-cinnamate dioxygenase ferredoxin reductase component